MINYIEDYFKFIKEATTAVQTVAACEKRLIAQGFQELKMAERWYTSTEGKYYVKPTHSMLTAFKMPAGSMGAKEFRIVVSHVDSPSIKIKPAPEMKSHNYVKLNTEVYSSPIISTWFDRPLSLAGTVAVKSDNILKPSIRYIDFKKAIAYLPSVAAKHLALTKGKEETIDRQKHLLPIIGLLTDQLEADGYLLALMAQELDVCQEDILDFDLFAYIYEEASLVGAKDEFITAPRVDDMSMSYTSLRGFLEATNKKNTENSAVQMVTFFDHEDVGSMTTSGAFSSVLPTILERIVIENNRTASQYQRILSNSFIISADNIHAIHPNYAERSDLTNQPLINKGIVIKQSGNRAYASTSETSGAIMQLCEHLGLTCQKYVNNSNIAGGKSLGPILSLQLPMKTVDIGIPMLGMHSAKELIGSNDFIDMIQLMSGFYCVK